MLGSSFYANMIVLILFVSSNNKNDNLEELSVVMNKVI